MNTTPPCRYQRLRSFEKTRYKTSPRVITLTRAITGYRKALCRTPWAPSTPELHSGLIQTADPGHRIARAGYHSVSNAPHPPGPVKRHKLARTPAIRPTRTPRTPISKWKVWQHDHKLWHLSGSAHSHTSSRPVTPARCVPKRRQCPSGPDFRRFPPSRSSPSVSFGSQAHVGSLSAPPRLAVDALVGRNVFILAGGAERTLGGAPEETLAVAHGTGEFRLARSRRARRPDGKAGG